MARLNTCSDEELTEEMVARLQQHTGNRKIPPVFRQMGSSAAALDAYLVMERGVALGSLSAREVEAIKLLVSEINRCDFCLSVHTVKAKAAGLDASLQQKIRAGTLHVDSERSAEPRLSAILEVTRHFFETRGSLDDARLAAARQAGLSDENLLDLVLAVSTIFLTNVFNHLNDTELVFAPAPQLANQ